jgi:hypothetical protein
LHVEALLVGHDLTRGTTHFSKPRRDAASTSGEEAATRQLTEEDELGEPVMVDEERAVAYAA